MVRGVEGCLLCLVCDDLCLCRSVRRLGQREVWAVGSRDLACRASAYSRARRLCSYSARAPSSSAVAAGVDRSMHTTRVRQLPRVRQPARRPLLHDDSSLAAGLRHCRPRARDTCWAARPQMCSRSRPRSAIGDSLWHWSFSPFRPSSGSEGSWTTGCGSGIVRAPVQRDIFSAPAKARGTVGAGLARGAGPPRSTAVASSLGTP